MRKIGLLLLLLFVSGCSGIESWFVNIQQPQGNTVLQGYQIVYLVDQHAVAPVDVVAPQRLEQDMGAIIADVWTTVLQAEAESPIELLIIHQSALLFIDQTWVQAAYGRGVVISFINVPLDQRLEVLGLTCLQGKFEPEPMETMGDFFTYQAFKVIAKPEIRQKLFEAHQQCQDMNSIRWSGSFSGGGGGDTLELPESYQIFMGTLQATLGNVNENME
jgi:hypothetical protein